MIKIFVCVKKKFGKQKFENETKRNGKNQLLPQQ